MTIIQVSAIHASADWNVPRSGTSHVSAFRILRSVAAALLSVLFVSPAAAGECLYYKNAKNLIIQNKTIGPCPDRGIFVEDSENVTIRNVTIQGIGDEGIYADTVKGLTIKGVTIKDAETGISVINSTSVRIDNNILSDVRGPVPGGQFVQFNEVTGPNNRITCNVMRTTPGKGLRPEDAISLYRSSGIAGSPILIQRNKIIGGGPSESGGGIMLGDDGGSYTIAADNVLVDPGQYGIAVSSGHNHSIVRNRIYARRQVWTNVGIYVWNQYGHSCRNAKVRTNRVNWTNADGSKNGFWDGENCGAITGLTTNSFNAPITALIANLPILKCPTP